LPETIINNESDTKSPPEPLGEDALIVEISDALSEKDRVDLTYLLHDNDANLSLFAGQIHGPH
jgi:hypothetical protein